MATRKKQVEETVVIDDEQPTFTITDDADEIAEMIEEIQELTDALDTKVNDIGEQLDAAEDLVQELTQEVASLTEDEDEDEVVGEQVFSAKEVARQCGVDARTFRKFIRDTKGGGKAVVGQGGRYAFNELEVKELKAAFTAWSTSAKTKVAKVDTPAKPKQTLQDVLGDGGSYGPDDEDEDEIFDLDDPTDEDLELIDIEG